MTRIAARTGGDASASSASRTAASPGTVARVVTASARTKKPPAPASRTQRELLRRGELGATATAVADESEDAPAAPLVERDPAVAVGAFVADSSRTDHADHTSNLSVRRLDVKDPAIRTVVLDRQEYPRVSHGSCHPATPRSDEARRALDRRRGRQGRAAGDERREDEDGSSGTRVHADGVRRPDAGWAV